MNMSIWCSLSRFGIQKPFLEVSAEQWQVEMSGEHRRDVRSQDPGVWELCWWKGKYICTQSSASLAVVVHCVSPIFQAPSRRPASWEIRAQSACWAADSIPVPAGRPGQAFQGGSWIQSWWVGSGRSSLWARSTPPPSATTGPSLWLRSLPPAQPPSPRHSVSWKLHDKYSMYEIINHDSGPQSLIIFYSDTLFLLFQENLLV